MSVRWYQIWYTDKNMSTQRAVGARYIRNFLGMCVLLCVLIGICMATPHAYALTFDPNYIISDVELENTGTMTAQDVQEFLWSHGSYLAQYKETIAGKDWSAAHIIADAGAKYSINPQFLLTLLQKEQSLVSDARPSQNQLDWAMGFGVCDSCSKSDPQLQGLKGFSAQVYAAAEKIRANYLRDLQTQGHTLSGWGPGISKFTVDGIMVTPFNRATAVLYTYNPYQGNTEVAGRSIGANFNFWKLWQNFFAKLLPDGTIARDSSKGSLYLIQDGKRRLFTSMSVFLSSYSLSQIVEAPVTDIEKYPLGMPIKFPQYSLLRSPKGAVFLLVGDTLRGIVSHEVFRTLGFNPDEIIQATDDDLRAYATGEPITLKTAYPQGALLQNVANGGVFYVKNGVKHPVIDKSLMLADFPTMKIIKVRAKELARYEQGEPQLINDGILVKGSGPDVYIVSHAIVRPIASARAFEKLGYDWKNIVTVADKVLALHVRGDAVDIVPEQYTMVVNE